ncbi:Hairy/enhancer-of-split with YRPW motif protein 1 [Mactra antiquata]
MENVTIREATLEDKNEVVDIRDDVYDGRDYIISRYDELITCPDTTAYIAFKNGKAVSFVAVTYIDAGKTVVTRAGRSSKSVTGQYINKYIIKQALIKAQQQGVIIRAFTTGNTPSSVDSEEYRLRNKMILSKKIIRFLVDTTSLPVNSHIVKNKLRKPDDNEINSYFENENTRRYLFPKERLICSWVPYKLHSSNFPHMRRPQENKRIFSDVTVDDDGRVTGLFSLSSTFQCIDPTYLTDLDIHGTDVTSLKNHVLSHFNFVRTIVNGVVSVLIFIEHGFDMVKLKKVLEEIGLSESPWYLNNDPNIPLYTEQRLYESIIQSLLANL